MVGTVLERASAIPRAGDRIAAGVGVGLAAAGIAGLGALGNVLLYFYVFYGVATLGVLLLLLVTAQSDACSVGHVPRWQRAVAIAAVALAARAYLFYHGPLLSFDLHWYADYVRFIQMHAAPYTTEFYLPYPQGFLDFLLPFAAVASPLNAIHWALIGSDCIVALGIFVLVDRIKPGGYGFWAGIAYALLPMAALETGRIGHFETLVNLCFVLLLLALRSRRVFAAAFAAGFAIIAAACLKVFPLIIAPIVIRTWRGRRAALLSIAGGAVALLLSVVPVATSVPRIISFWLGSSSSSPAAAGTFTANSLRALAADVPPATPIVAAAQGVAVIVFVLLVVYAIRSVRNAEPDAQTGALAIRATIRRNAELGLQVHIPSLGRFFLAALAAAFLVYGCYLIGKPWMPSQYEYSWWSPSPMLIAVGTALAGLAAIALVAAYRDDTALEPVQILAAAMAAVIGYVILLRANVNPWYMMPIAVLLLAMLPSRFVVPVLGCLLVFYAQYNSTSFSKIGWNDVITIPHQWSVTRGDEPGSEAAGSVTALSDARYLLQLANPAKETFLKIRYGSCAPDDVAFSLRGNGQAMRYSGPVLNGSAVLIVPRVLGRTVELFLHRTACEAHPLLVRSVPSPGEVGTSGGDVSVTIPATQTPGGWGHSVSASSRTFAYAFPNTALAFDLTTDTDPTFHRWPLAVSAFVSGTTVDGRKSGQVAVLSRDTSVTNIGPIRFRIPVFNLPAELNTIDRVTFTVDTVMADGKAHTMRISNVRMVNETRWARWTAEATAIAVICVLLALGIIARKSME